MNGAKIETKTVESNKSEHFFQSIDELHCSGLREVNQIYLIQQRGVTVEIKSE